MEDVGMEIILETQCILKQKGYLRQCRIPVPWRSLAHYCMPVIDILYCHLKNILLLVLCTTVEVNVVRLCTCSILMKKLI